MFRIEHNAETGEIKEIKLTAEEIKALQAERLDLPMAQPEPLTVEEKLASVGLNLDDLKTALGL
jgi:hypothetical protein